MNVVDSILGKVSVVIMALAVLSQASWLDSRFLYAVGILERIFLIGNLWPITPVDITSEVGPLWSSGCDFRWKQAVASLAMASASSRPPLPVTALAQPELMMIERRPAPPRRSRTERETCTGAAWNLLVVKTAAPKEGRSLTMKARSGLLVLDGLTPTWVPETEKPLGYVPEVGTYFSFEAGTDESIGAE